VSKETKSVAKNKMSSATMDLCRNTPILELQLEELVSQNFKPTKSFENLKINDD